uniref:IPT/TIG domain-containing protein n=1 Tax=Arcella intermedia TaxID=1963864 RepID=A0A6B2KYQ6_9EUKA
MPNNNIQGSFSNFDWTQWPYLSILVLIGNNITGSIPTSFYNSPFSRTLEEFQFAQNSMSGVVLPSISSFSSLRIFDIYSNKFSGTIPPEMFSMPSLQRMRMGVNQFSGGLTITSTKAPLSFLDLSENRLNGNFPPQLYNFTSLTLLRLAGIPASKIGLKGTLSKEISNLQSLTILDLSFNLLYGTLPSEVCNLYNLNQFSLQLNSFSGTLPNRWDNLRNIQILTLGQNSFSGTIPESIYSCNTLQLLDLGVNYLSGTISPSVGNFINLYSINLNGQASKTVPASKRLSGSIPENIWKLPQLKILYLAFNVLTGTIGTNVGFDEPNLETISIENNKFSGPLPDSLYRLTRLSFLVLKTNEFTGKLKDDIAQLPLTTFDISTNKLQGWVPLFFNESHSLNIKKPLEKNTFACPLPKMSAKLFGANCLNPSIYRLDPSLGFSEKTIYVKVTGFALCPTLISTMYFLLTDTHNTTVNGTLFLDDKNTMTMTLTPSSLIGPCSFSLYLDNRKLVSTSGVTSITMYGRPRISHFYPNIWREQGGFRRDKVHIFGSHFYPTGKGVCKYGTETVPVQFVNSTYVYCDIPAVPEEIDVNTTVPFLVGNDAENFQLEVLNFTYFPYCYGDPVCGGEAKGNCTQVPGIHPFCTCRTEGFNNSTYCFDCLPLHYGFECDACRNCHFGTCLEGYEGSGDCQCSWFAFWTRDCSWNWGLQVMTPAVGGVLLIILIIIGACWRARRNLAAGREHRASVRKNEGSPLLGPQE